MGVIQSRTKIFPIFISFLLLSMISPHLGAQVCTQHTFLANQPDEGNPGWSHEAQGITHDADHWYITQKDALWRIPVTRDLGQSVFMLRNCDELEGDERIECQITCYVNPIPLPSCFVMAAEVGHKHISETALADLGYDHFGDLDYYESGTLKFLVVPIEKIGGGGPPPGMAFFRADETLDLFAIAEFTEEQQTFSSWVAIDPDGMLVSSTGGGITELTRYRINWNDIQDDGPVPVVGLIPQPRIVLHFLGNTETFFLDSMQGGEFSDDDQILYLSNGYIAGLCTCKLDIRACNDPPSGHPSWGVHVFRTRPGVGAECPDGGTCTIAREIERSVNDQPPPAEFNYVFDPTFDNCEEAEGLTFWDLDADGRAPLLPNGDSPGQLHVILLDNDAPDIIGDDIDDVYVKHYRLELDDLIAPEITCPLHTTAECSAQSGVPASDPQLASFFAQAAATDNCDENPTLSNNAPDFFPLGTSTVTFIASDDFGNTSQSCQADVTVIDSTPPQIQCPLPVTVECTGNNGIPVDDPQLASFFNVSANDVCDPSLTITNNAPELLPLGQTLISFITTDDSSNGAGCSSLVMVADTTAPEITVIVTPLELWPPDHRLVPLTAQVTVVDRCDPSISFQLVSITSNEPDNGLGDGDTNNDIQDADFGTADINFKLRAERSGNGSGRIYTILYRTSDASGNVREATAYVTAPH